MPVARRQTENHKKDEDQLRPYIHHGIQFSTDRNHAIADCPFCNREDKFSVAVDSGLWRCFVCGAGTEKGGGNALVFIRTLHERAFSATSTFLKEVAHDRKLLDPITVSTWGICRSPLTNNWLVPGYGTDGKLNQLYKRVSIKDSKGEWSWRLLPTPGIWPDGKVHALHLAISDFDPARPKVDIMEGPWDGMALWEVARWSDTNIVAAPGCNIWRDEWTTLCKGKHVTIWFDSDHPRKSGGKEMRAGFDGVQRVARRIRDVAASVQWMRWGEDGYDPDLPDGWDVRDELSSTTNRQSALESLLSRVEEAPSEWFTEPSKNGKPHNNVLTQHCDNWFECERAWIDAYQWRQDMGDSLAVLLAVCASTQQGGNQLFVQLVGSAGSGKTSICEGLLVSQHCHHLEHLTGFHSGWREPGGDGKDCSLIARINGKTLVTPEGDVLMSSPHFDEIMSQQRRIFDGTSGATYKNTSEDRLHTGLRTPWIMAGTPALLDKDQSRLGDRFMRCIINDPDNAEKRSIVRAALRAERTAMLGTSDGTSGSLVDPKLRKAQALTGGYVDWLRKNVEKLLTEVEIYEEAEDCCVDLAELSADMRARPNEDRRKVEVHDSKELPTRLARQNIRLASCLAVVLNRRTVDKDILRIVRKVALDTAHGHTLNITRWLCSLNPKVLDKSYQERGGLTVETLSMWSGMTHERMHKYLMFLRNIEVLKWKEVKQTNGYWLLTDRVYELYKRVMRS